MVKKTMIGLFFLLFLVSALAQTSYADELQAQCLARNPVDREVWQWSVTDGSPAGSVGGAVDSHEITHQLQEDGSLLIQYGNCIQVDCVQNSFETQRTPFKCTNGQQEYHFYSVSYSFPGCDASYSLQSSFSLDPICMRCPNATVSEYSNNGCFEGHQLRTQNVEIFYDYNPANVPACSSRMSVSTEITNNPCVAGGLDLSFLPWVLVLAIVVLIGFVWYRNIKKH